MWGSKMRQYSPSSMAYLMSLHEMSGRERTTLSEKVVMIVMLYDWKYGLCFWEAMISARRASQDGGSGFLH